MAQASTALQPDSAMVAAHILCDACSRVFRESKWAQHLAGRTPVDETPNSAHVDIFLHSLDKEQLRRSSAGGCHLCTMVMENDEDFTDDDDESGVIQADVWFSVYAEVDDEKVCMTLRRITNILASDFCPGDSDGIESSLRQQGEVDWQARNQYENPISDLFLFWAKGKCTQQNVIVELDIVTNCYLCHQTRTFSILDRCYAPAALSHPRPLRPKL